MGTSFGKHRPKGRTKRDVEGIERHSGAMDALGRGTVKKNWYEKSDNSIDVSTNERQIGHEVLKVWKEDDPNAPPLSNRIQYPRAIPTDLAHEHIDEALEAGEPKSLLSTPISQSTIEKAS